MLTAGFLSRTYHGQALMDDYKPADCMNIMVFLKCKTF